MNRRDLLGGIAAAFGGVVAGALGGFGLQSAAARSELSAMTKDENVLRTALNRVALRASSGGGVNLKLMPDPVTGQPTVPMQEVFSFNHEMAMCRVDTNTAAFKMPTNKMGEVTIQPHQFFMAMVATSVDRFVVETMPDGKRKLAMEGGLDCITEVAQATVTIGSRTVGEPADYTIEAVDAGPGGGRAGDSFAFTAFFDPNKAPINFAIFGPKSTFTGIMVSGEITIVDPALAEGTVH